MLEIRNVYKSYDGKTDAIKDISLDIESGDIFAFIGHNGAGKTTLIKCIVGLLEFDRGTIKIDGIDVKDNLLDAKKIFAYIPDNPNIYESMSGIQYLNFICDAFNLPIGERREKIQKYSTILDMSGKLGDKISSYSHGMKQKLVIIGALIHSPKLLILDEPFNGLDNNGVKEIRQLLIELKEKGKTIIVASHNSEDIKILCDKVYSMDNGVLSNC